MLGPLLLIDCGAHGDEGTLASAGEAGAVDGDLAGVGDGDLEAKTSVGEAGARDGDLAGAGDGVINAETFAREACARDGPLAGAGARALDAEELLQRLVLEMKHWQLHMMVGLTP
ncbi:hypothetical protein E2562_017336 [Oryza meyeriana var. granulata]|uniref:Uncharacterized protein n=1 Tax=Oryza meyeriana var. granulata TaxID=110450 RepID=A0A6G1BY39_9ORYZ|nr:hypothetical protein E2562_017336 [Oryza meyeriana var. granulata]